MSTEDKNVFFIKLKIWDTDENGRIKGIVRDCNCLLDVETISAESITSSIEKCLSKSKGFNSYQILDIKRI